MRYQRSQQAPLRLYCAARSRNSVKTLNMCGRCSNLQHSNMILRINYGPSNFVIHKMWKPQYTEDLNKSRRLKTKAGVTPAAWPSGGSCTKAVINERVGKLSTIAAVFGEISCTTGRPSRGVDNEENQLCRLIKKIWVTRMLYKINGCVSSSVHISELLK